MPDVPSRDRRFSAADIRRAASEGVIEPDGADRLLAWAALQAVGAPAGRERAKGLNLVSIAYYFGALLMISACAWFLGDKWDVLGDGGILMTCLVYAAIALAIGAWLRGRGFVAAGGLLVTVAVSLTPLISYTVEDMLGMWPAKNPGSYKDFYPLIHGSWIVMDTSRTTCSRTRCSSRSSSPQSASV